MHHHRKPRDSSGSIGAKLSALVFFLGLATFLVCAALYLRNISTQIAVSDASDAVSMRVNRVISEVMSEGNYDGDYFITFEKGENGDVSAISCNMARINALSSKILDRVVGATENETMTVSIPLGNLTGLSMLMGRGPKVPVEIVMLTSSRVVFNNNIVTAGINQTKHQITLLIRVDIDILVPWGTESTQVLSEVLIADTVIVGKVPGTYLDMKGNGQE